MPNERSSSALGVSLKRLVLLAGLGILSAATTAAFAGGPRFVSGSGLAVQPGQPEGWGTSQLLYYTDPGGLGASVSHAQADAMVAAAAAVWNVPTSMLAIAQGGQLAEHVSGANSYFDGSQFVFPADVQLSNEAAVPVAVIYDGDGSITDLLLGSGASEPSDCRQNAVTQSVDDVQGDGHIHHALVVLNGRCVGSAPEQLTQMQYLLARAFGRVLGLAWSQTNDNVFTGATQINSDQMANWPLMHPLDVLCGPYSYQCMLNPFTLRADDLSGLATLYPVLGSSVPAGKQPSNTGGDFLFLSAQFPTGQGMDWLNIVATRNHYGVQEAYQVVSGLSGGDFQQSLQSPVTHVAAVNEGTWNTAFEGIAVLRAVPVEGLSDVTLRSEPINPLYTAEYAIGPYARPPVAPSGSPQGFTYYSQFQLFDLPLGSSSTAWDAASICNPGSDGSESAPAPLDPSGWQAGQLCGWGHSSWWSAAVRAGRSWTLEVTATDETGAATISKAQTVLGIWKATDATGTLPTVAAEAVPFNSTAFGVTQIQMPAASSDTHLRFVVGDAYGGGRPDFTYTTRMLYADSITPVTVGAGGGTITITGTGFRQGNVVRINGVSAAVKSWSATRIVAVAPSAALAGAHAGNAVTVSVSDGNTAGTTSIARALTYTKAADLLQLASSPVSLETGVMSSVPFAVRLLASDASTPIVGAPVQFVVSSGQASYSACVPSSPCIAITDSNGIAQMQVTAASTGSITLVAADVNTGTELQVILATLNPAHAVTLSSGAVYVAAGANDSWTLQLNALQDGAPTAGVAINWSASSGLNIVASASSTAAGGWAQATVHPGNVMAGSAQTLTGCAWGSVCATWTLYGVDPSQVQVTASSGAGQSVPATMNLGGLGLLVTDEAGHPVQDAAVTIHQRVLGWDGVCSGADRCPAAPVLASTETTMLSDGNGAVTFPPLQLAGRAQTVEIAITTGTQELLTLTLVKTPVLP